MDPITARKLTTENIRKVWKNLIFTHKNNFQKISGNSLHPKVSTQNKH